MSNGTDQRPQTPLLSTASLAAIAVMVTLLGWANLAHTIRHRTPSWYVGGVMVIDGEFKDTGFFDPSSAPTFVCREQGWPLGFDAYLLRSNHRDGTTTAIPAASVGKVDILRFARATDGCTIVIELANGNLIPGFLEQITKADDFRRFGAFVEIHDFDRVADADALLDVLRPFNEHI